ncbi:alanine racemase (plasmid) [Mesorhizobium sp. 131-2-5]|uniref:Alanine racemase 3 n=1 Tax=Mesorhizobium japonicum (strain LMG 29417 / CECT 9101 / MAFF 303099) TaxID=266835 RepID=ALR3_RHILO|nr:MULTISPECIES: alanine racemase [Mesorhizobium]Q981H7.1 RecName: Full=Alanine racemase 3 [Mesorhizobium japonicum MAFF 303099]BAB54978.1 alanine racemase [Mesorhizobium japonicum MAFF 303099]BCH04919.1 alanine racemase [Mesorhizobium sp. 131-2-5]
MLTSVRPADVVLEIDLSAIQANFQTISALVGPQVRVAAVVKSDAYGLGLVKVAGALIDAGCDLLFVGNLHEALLLRSSHISAAVAVFCDEFARYGEHYRSNGLIPVVNNSVELDAICGAREPQAYFLNVETGLSRLGLAFDDVRRRYLGGIFKRRPPSVVLSHLACSERAGDAMNLLQWNRFRATSDLLKPTLLSLAASAGVWLGKRYHFDMVRVGSALYGLNSAGIRPNPLKPVVGVKAKTLDARNVARSEAVGYGATFRTGRASRLAIAGIGYKHGLPWACANKISVRFAGYSAPLVGRVSMEYITIDVTDVPEALCGPGTNVELLSDDFTVDDLAASAGVHPQEVLTRLGVGCARQYLDGSSASAGFPGNLTNAGPGHDPRAILG